MFNKYGNPVVNEPLYNLEDEIFEKVRKIFDEYPDATFLEIRAASDCLLRSVTIGIYDVLLKKQIIQKDKIKNV